MATGTDNARSMSGGVAAYMEPASLGNATDMPALLRRKTSQGKGGRTERKET